MIWVKIICLICKFKNKLQLKSQKVIIHTIVDDSEQSDMKFIITKRESVLNKLCE
jgi:hypothetical protein